MFNKNFYFFIICFLFIFVFGCSEKNYKKLNLDDFIIDIQTEDEFEIYLDKDFYEFNEVGSFLKKHYIQKQDEFVFKDSLFLSEVGLPKGVLLDKFFDSNLVQLKKTFSFVNNFVVTNKTFECNEIEVKGNVLEFVIDYSTQEEESSFGKVNVAQYFFVIDSRGYIVSFVSNNSKKLKNFISSLQSLKCQSYLDSE